MKILKLLSPFLLLCASASATSIRGQLLTVGGQPLPGGSLTMTLSSIDNTGAVVAGCAGGTPPNVRNSGTISSGNMTKIVSAGAGGNLFDTVVGTDQINCGAGFGVGSFYHVVAKDPTGVVSWTKDYNITGATWTPQSTPLNVFPPTVFPSPILSNPGGSQTIIQPGGTSLTISGTLIATLTGNASTASALANNPTDCAAHTYATAIDAAGNLTCTAVTPAELPAQLVYNNLANTYTAGSKQTFTSSATTPGVGFAGVTADPSGATQGSLWFRSDLNRVRLFTTSAQSLALTSEAALLASANIFTASPQTFNQAANGNDVLVSTRFTDSSPTGNFLNFKTAAGASVWQVDVSGSLVAGSIPSARLANSVSAATNTKITYNAQGLITGGSQAAASDLSNGTSGSGAICLVTNCVLTTPSLGAATATSITGLTGSLTPNAAGGIDVGSAALPFSGIRIGGAATNNIRVTGTATASRTATLPDNTGTLAELNLAQTWTAVQTFNSGNLLLVGATSGTLTVNASAIAGSNTATFPANTGTVAELNLAQAWTAAQTFNSSGIIMNGTVSGTLTLAATGAMGSSVATFPINTGTVAETNLGQTWSGNQTNVALVTPSIGGETITKAPRGVVSGFLTATGPGVGGITRFTPDQAITITSIHYAVPPGGTTGAGCTTAPVLRINNGTTNGPSITLTNGNSTGDLTGQSVNYPAGTALQIEISVASSGCSTPWANLNVSAQYKMQ